MPISSRRPSSGIHSCAFGACSHNPTTLRPSLWTKRGYATRRLNSSLPCVLSSAFTKIPTNLSNYADAGFHAPLIPRFFTRLSHTRPEGAPARAATRNVWWVRVQDPLNALLRSGENPKHPWNGNYPVTVTDPLRFPHSDRPRCPKFGYRHQVSCSPRPDADRCPRTPPRLRHPSRSVH